MAISDAQLLEAAYLTIVVPGFYHEPPRPVMYTHTKFQRIRYCVIFIFCTEMRNIALSETHGRVSDNSTNFLAHLLGASNEPIILGVIEPNYTEFWQDIDQSSALSNFFWILNTTLYF